MGSGGFDSGSGAANGAGNGASTFVGAGGNNVTASTGAGGLSATLIYGNDDTTLVQLDPTSPDLTVTTIGDFDCIDPNGSSDYAMTDIAVNARGELWGVTGHTVHSLTIMGSTVHCGPSISLSNSDARFYALTFAPAGVLDPTQEVLVAGNTNGELWKIDGASGALEQHGVFGAVPHDDGHGYVYANAGQAWELSGDLVFLAHDGDPVGFATVRDCPSPPDTTGCNDVNTLIEIDMTAIGAPGAQMVTKAIQGAIVKGATCSDPTDRFGNMYGIAAWNDKVFGFSRDGLLVDIDINDGSACLVKSYPSLPFAGAGVTTLAPVSVNPH